MLSWPRPGETRLSLTGAALGLASGLCIRLRVPERLSVHATLALDATHPLFAAVTSVAVVLGHADGGARPVPPVRETSASPGATVARRWRPSLGAGLCGACAYGGLVHRPGARAGSAGAGAGHHRGAHGGARGGTELFRESLSLRQIAAGAAIVARRAPDHPLLSGSTSGFDPPAADSPPETADFPHAPTADGLSAEHVAGRGWPACLRAPGRCGFISRTQRDGAFWGSGGLSSSRDIPHRRLRPRRRPGLRRSWLLAAGGAGPMHAASLRRWLGGRR